MDHSIKPIPSFLLLVLGLLLTLLVSNPSYGAVANPIVDLPTDYDDAIAGGQTLTGTLNGANYRIRVPAGFRNGTLLVYAHGHRDKADHDGEIDDTSADAALGGAAMEDALLALGYAVAGSAYRDNGWAVQEGISDTLALTNHFRNTIGAPSKTILWGSSMGSVVTFKSIELYPDVYDGAIPMCGVAAGSTMSFDSTLAFTAAYDVAFGWPESWGTVADVRDDLDFETEVAPVLVPQAQQQSNFGKFEFIRLVSGLPMDGFYEDVGGSTPWLFTGMYFLTEARAELERRAGGPAIQNANHIYTLTDEEKTYLTGLGVDAESMLTEVNNRTNIEANPTARAYLEQYADYTGNITRPVITLHTTKDGLMSVANETVYKEKVAEAGQSDLLYQVYTESVGHCTFTLEQLIATISAMDKWLTAPEGADSLNGPTPPGPAPTAADFTAAGFVNDFVPPAWPITFSDDPTNVSLAEFSAQAAAGGGWFALLPMLMVLAGFFYLRRRNT